jgi:hypothetical protein
MLFVFLFIFLIEFLYLLDLVLIILIDIFFLFKIIYEIGFCFQFLPQTFLSIRFSSIILINLEKKH